MYAYFGIWKELPIFSAPIFIKARGHSITTWTRWAGGGVQKMSVFVHAQGIKTVHAKGGGGQKMVKFCPHSCWMTPNGPLILIMSRFIYTNDHKQPLFGLFLICSLLLDLSSTGLPSKHILGISAPPTIFRLSTVPVGLMEKLIV